MSRPIRPVRVVRVTALLAASLLAACDPPIKRTPSSAASDTPTPVQSPPAQTATTPAPAERVQLFPHVHANIRERWIELDGIVPLDAHDPKTPIVFLELVACTPDSKEHESLVMTRARPSDVHAALLAIGLTPGAPGAFKLESGKLTSIPATGDPVTITVAVPDADPPAPPVPITDWIVHARTGKGFAESNPGKGFVFAGSRFVTRQGRERYDADGAGTLIGLTTFGGETIAWSAAISPDSSLDEPVWIARASLVPRFATPVVVRISAAR
jgi:hypothetical protein